MMKSNDGGPYVKIRGAITAAVVVGAFAFFAGERCR